MECTDLMLDDWVIDTYTGKPMRVPCVNIKVGKGLDPIPITPEILEKNGFDECIWVGKKSWRRRYLVHNEILICIDGRDGGFMHFGYQGYNSEICITYVHELQHALRLCGIEKEIVL